MNTPPRRVGILGSGVMGSAIAAHFANAGVSSLVLDILPPDLPADKSDDPAARNALADAAIGAMRKARPAPLFTAARASLIETGNLADDLPRLRECDWVIEVVTENLEIKKIVLADAAPHIGPEAWLSSNTSGLSLAAMAEALPADLRPRFFGSHFFNPPRYMKLLELIPGPGTDPGVLDRVADFSSLRLGKGVVRAKDTPNFVANRIGVHAILQTVAVMADMGLTIEEVDALTGPAIGRPKTATFKLADLVGLDTLLHVAGNLREAVADDECRDLFTPPPYLAKMVEKGLLGRKSGAGFYRMEKKDGRREILTLDFETLEYRPKKKAAFAEIKAAKSEDDLDARLRQLVLGKGRAAEALWRMIAPNCVYAARRLGEICDDAAQIDRAMRWGFNWSRGPFEAWDALGFRTVVERLREEKTSLPGWVDELYESGAESIYTRRDGELLAPAAPEGRPAAVPTDPRVFDFALLKRGNRIVKSNPGASLLDLGDGVLALEFHSKMNALGPDAIGMIKTACAAAETGGRALVVANQGENFSVGANLMMLVMEALEGEWDDLNMIVRAFQDAADSLETCAVPVVAAPHALTLGGGCEMTLAANAVRAAAETYIGLVEFGAGVVPAGGGCARLYQRHVALLNDRGDLYPALKATFETIGMAKVATSAEEARELGFLRPGDAWSMHGDHRVADAKALALALAEGGFAPPPADRMVPVMGRSGIALCESVLFNMHEAGYISEHDRRIGGELARVLCGGDVPGPTEITHRHMLDLEREAFLRLLGERKTLERMQHLLKTGKPLRN